MQTTSGIVLSLVKEAFESAWHNKINIVENSKRSSYFVSQLSKVFSREFHGEALVQKTDQNGKKVSGEWLLDIAIVSKTEVGTTYKNRKATIVDKIIWAIESEFSTNLNEFCKDFSKLIHIKSEAYLYIAGLNQHNKKSREAYINAQSEFAKSLVDRHKITEPFYIVFVPTPGKSGTEDSVWDTEFKEDSVSGASLDEFKLAKLKSWIHIVGISSKI